MPIYEDPDVSATGIDALRALGMSEAAISEFISAAGLQAIYADELVLQSGPRPRLLVRLREQETRSRWVASFSLPNLESPDLRRAIAALPEAVARRDGIGQDETFIWDDRARSWYKHVEITGAFSLGVLELAVGGGALWFLGKMADAYVSRIADRLAETTFKAAERVKLRRGLDNDRVIIKLPVDTTTIVLPDPLTDEAREAFIDLDPTADGIRGKTLYWDPGKRVWIPRDRPHLGQKGYQAKSFDADWFADDD